MAEWCLCIDYGADTVPEMRRLWWPGPKGERIFCSGIRQV